MVDIPAGDWITVAEAAGILGRTPRLVQALIKDGKLPARRVGRAYLLLRPDVERFSAKPRPAGWKKGVPRKPKKKGRKK
jgi:excisionase family DNA binding protein